MLNSKFSIKIKNENVVFDRAFQKWKAFYSLFFIMNFKDHPELVKIVDDEYKKINALSTEEYIKWLDTASSESINRYNDYSAWLKELNKHPSVKQKVYKAIVNIYKLFKIIFDGPLGFILSKIIIAVLITLLICGSFAGIVAVIFTIAYLFQFNIFLGIFASLFLLVLIGLLLESL
jgi:hypothetical protein